MFIINLFFLVSLSLKLVHSLEPKICVNCRYYIKNEVFLSHDKYGKCLLFKLNEPEDIYTKRQELLDFMETGYEKKRKYILYFARCYVFRPVLNL